MINKKPLKLKVRNFKKYWVTDTSQGSLIKICYGEDDRVMEIDCRWSDRNRDVSGRVYNGKK